MAAQVVRDVRGPEADHATLSDLRYHAMRAVKLLLMLGIMIFLVQQIQKISSDPGYIDRVFDMITDDTSIEDLEGK